MNEKIRDMFSRIAPRYDLLNRIMSFGIDKRWRKYAVSKTGDRKSLHVLDLCSGSGDMAVAYLGQNDKATITLVDFSEEILRLARNKLHNQGADSRSHFVIADALRLPFPDGCFDAILCGFGARNIDPPVDLLIEARRVLRRRGMFVILDFFRPEGLLRRFILATAISIVVPLLGGIIGRNYRAYRYLVRSIKENLSVSEFCLLAETIGFRKMSADSIGRGFAHIVTGEC